MADTAAAQLRRILELIPECADDRPHRIADVAARAGTTPAVLLRDLRALSERFDDPGGFVEGVQIFVEADRFQVRSSHFLRPMRLTIGELGALELGLALLRPVTPREELGTLDSARERLQAALSRLPEEEPALPAHFATVAPAPDPAVLATLRGAYQESRKARIRYLKATEAEPSERTVCPFAIVHSASRWYLVAECDAREDLRVFRVDRILAATQLEESYTVPEEFSVADVLRGGRVLMTDGGERCTVRYSPAIARWIGEREGKTPDPDGSLVTEHELADPDWAIRHVMQYGPDAEILEPPWLREAMVERVRGLLGADVRRET